ncbi:hypothetical protein V8D89_007043 [Ganoderma adspersum]
MSQQSVAKQTVAMDSPSHSGLHSHKTGPSGGVMLFPYARPRAMNLKDTFGIDIEAGVNVSPRRPSSGSRAVVLHRILKGFQAAATSIPRALALGLPCSAGLYALGTMSLNGIHGGPQISVRLALKEVIVSLGGAALAAPATMSAITFVLHGLGWKDQSIAACLDKMAGILGLLSSMFAIPLGFTIMSFVAPETFVVWHALAVTAMGLGVVAALLMLVYGLIPALVAVLSTAAS